MQSEEPIESSYWKHSRLETKEPLLGQKKPIEATSTRLTCTKRQCDVRDEVLHRDGHGARGLRHLVDHNRRRHLGRRRPRTQPAQRVEPATIPQSQPRSEECQLVFKRLVIFRLIGFRQVVSGRSIRTFKRHSTVGSAGFGRALSASFCTHR